MPWGEVTLSPTVTTEYTAADAPSSVVSSSFIRWKGNLVEKRGGWTLFINGVFLGVTRCLHAWDDLEGDSRLAVGTTQRLYVYEAGGQPQDITPQYSTSSITCQLSTTIGSPLVEVADASSNLTLYDSVVFNTYASVGGLVLFGSYPVSSAIDSGHYYINAGANATAAVTNGGAVPQFTVTNGSSTVKVTLANHNEAVGNEVSYPISTTVGGVTIVGLYIVQSVIDTSNYTIVASTSGNTNANGYMNGGKLNLTRWLVNGPQVAGSGWGAGGWGSGGWGTGVSPVFTPGTEITATDWWLDNIGEVLVSCPTGGNLFYWTSTNGYSTSALIPNSPLANNGMFVSLPSQQIMAWGSTYNAISDPLQIRWSDAFNFDVWYPTATNQAGGYHLPTGSRIVSGLQGPQQTYWFTDIDVYVGQYVGPPNVWQFNKFGTGCGLIAPKAVVNASGTIFWMSQKQFFSITENAGVTPIMCPVWDVVFQNLNTNYVNNIRCGANAQFNEVVWYYPSTASTGENDSYVCYNWQTQGWDYGSIIRTAWIDQSVWGGPIGASTDGYLYQHETSNDAAGQPINPTFTTGYVSLTNGEDLVFVDYLVPDFKWGQYSQAQTAQIQITLSVVDYPGQTPRVIGPFTVTQQTTAINPRFRGRFMKLTIASSDLGSFWRIGSIRFRYSADGRR